ncbi:hypothetical protein C7974DRAFT_137239 [Boeremia exigua]|uniref:uncharacterized protein n=1 Tax=Boeremia exigua TaxID=749465 RepID=UPI001E8D924F|nr:uncharacterized protein C7974DRAFT_137239 [Boeremia exigua]KAH6639708.1 hypothetical protein C7974DRAFT_137239 [Boeremia exigua]
MSLSAHLHSLFEEVTLFASCKSLGCSDVLHILFSCLLIIQSLHNQCAFLVVFLEILLVADTLQSPTLLPSLYMCCMAAIGMTICEWILIRIMLLLLTITTRTLFVVEWAYVWKSKVLFGSQIDTAKPRSHSGIRQCASVMRHTATPAHSKFPTSFHTCAHASAQR